MKNAIALILIFGGIIMAAGSGGDCDGKCMEYANTLSETLMYAFIGFMMMAIGTILVISQENS